MKRKLTVDFLEGHSLYKSIKVYQFILILAEKHRLRDRYV